MVLVEYTDYQCPYCGEADPIVKALQARLGQELCYVFRNFPLADKHEFAETAAEAAEAAGAQGLFWEMHDLLFEHQEALADEDLAEYAVQAGVDLARWAADLQSGRWTERVRRDLESGIRSGVSGTPSFFINGDRHDGDYQFDSLLAALLEQRAT